MTRSLPLPTDFEWLSEPVNACPYDFYESLHKYEPVFQAPGTNLYGTDVFLISRWEDIAFVAQHPEDFVQYLGDAASEYTEFFGGCSYSGAPKGLHSPYPTFYTDGPDHRIKRRWSLDLVNREQLVRAREIIRRYTHRAIDAVLEDRQCEFRRAVAEVVPPPVIAEIVGTSADDVDVWNRKDIEPSASRQRARRYVEDEILRRYRDPADDLMSRMICEQVEMDGGLDLNFQIAHWTNVLTAGSVTSVHMLSNLMQLLLLNRDVMAEVRQDSDALTRAVEESLRLETPIQVLPRLAVVDSVVGGVRIPAGSVLALLYGAGNRDGAKFPDPTRFDINRPRLQRNSLGFGLGKHRCAGAPLARLEGVVVFECIFERLRDIRIDVERSDLTKAPGLSGVDFGPRSLYINFTPS